MHSTPHSSVAAMAHLVENEQLLAPLPIVEKRHRDHRLHLALVNAVSSIAASMLGCDGQTFTGEDR
jgi:hypothetical protein